MLSSSFRRTALSSRRILSQSFATGPASGGSISDEMLQKLGSLSTQALVDGLWVMGWPSAQIDGARPLTSGMKCVGRAVTLNFVPARPDIAQDKPAGGDSPEYEAFELCGPNEVLVMSSVGPAESVGGDIKFLRLKQRDIGGLVTDGSVRDTDEIINYGFPVSFLLRKQSLTIKHFLNEENAISKSCPPFHSTSAFPIPLLLVKGLLRCNHGNAMASLA